MTHIRYFAAAAEAAGTDSEQIGLDEIGAQEISVDKHPTTLGEPSTTLPDATPASPRCSGCRVSW